MSCLGLDIGGANLKAADGRGWARSVAFPLWQQPEKLADEIRQLVASAPACHRLAVTMTGELCDCFATKANGVRHILSAAEQAAPDSDVLVYLVEGRFATLDEARELPHLAAASNWHALASFACRYVSNNAGILIDIGSTTTDIVPLVGGRVASSSLSDLDRLAAGELVYTGVGRTPICAIAQHLPWQGKPCPIAAELFATSADAYLLLGELEENPSASWTADGQPFTVEHSRRRLARMLCADASEVGADALQAIAAAIRDCQARQLERAIANMVERMPERLSTFVVSGSGEFLSRAVAQRFADGQSIVSLSAELGPEVSRCAPAHAVAVLAEESIPAGKLDKRTQSA